MCLTSTRENTLRKDSAVNEVFFLGFLNTHQQRMNLTDDRVCSDSFEYM
jgi:hypothetical protein